MSTQPRLPGRTCSVQVAPASSEIITALSSLLPTHFSPGVVMQRKIGAISRPAGNTTGSWRTNTPPV